MANHVTDKLNQYLKQDYSVLDVCCGNGTVSSGLIYKNINGVDICEEYLNEYNKKVKNSIITKLNIEDYIKKNDNERKKIFSDNSYDVVICIDGVEHFPEEESNLFIKELERIAIKKVIIFTPEHAENPELIVINYPSNVWGTTAGDQFQIHKSAQYRDKYKKLGYTFEEMGKYRNPYDKSYYYEMLYIKEKQ